MTKAYLQMEHKLLTIIMHPSLLLTLGFGIALIFLNPSVLRAPWFHAKLGAVFFLIAYQILAVITHKRFARGDYWLSEKVCRLINEVPTILLIVIVILVVVKPI